ncbi:MAG: arginine--tRNA ligase [bacterium]|nr:arginine--tRNA ligase [bacterium]
MKEKIESKLKSVFKRFGYDEDYARVSVSNKPLFDYQNNSAFVIAKERGCNPLEVAKEIVNGIGELSDFDDYFLKVEECVPGFINIKISDKLILDCLNESISLGNYGISKIGEDKTCVVDYGGPNIAKPLHVGHMRPAIIGQSIYEILKAKGYKVIGDVHLGDFGLQMGQVIYGLKKEKISKEDIDIDVLQRIYPKMSSLCKEDEDVLNECRRITKELQDGNLEYTEYFKKMYEASLNDIKRVYSYLGVSFDYWYGERDSYKYIDDLMAFLEKKQVLETDDGAKIIRVDEKDDKKEMPPLIVEGKSGAYLYATSDMATIYQRMKDFNPDYILYVVDNRQRLYFEQVFRACKKSGLTGDTILEHNYFGTINGPDGKPFKTRSGETLKLDDLINKTKEIFISKKESNKSMKDEDIDIITNAILKFADLQNNREKNYIFDIERFADVNGKTGPYILYTAVRIRKLVNSNIKDDTLSSTIYNDDDRNLRKKLLEVDSVVTRAALERMPHYIAEYLYDLAVLVNTFYQNNNISNLDDEVKKLDWINLLSYTYDVISKLLGLLIIKIPSEM